MEIPSKIFSVFFYFFTLLIIDFFSSLWVIKGYIMVTKLEKIKKILLAKNINII